MASLLWLRCLLCLLGLAGLRAHPLPANSPGADVETGHWQVHWPKYIIGLLGITITAFTLVGCLCCRRNRRPKGFQDSGGSIDKEFKDGHSIDNEPSVPQLQGLELQVPVSVDPVQFEPLPVERFVPEVCVSPRPKPPPPSTSSVHDDESESDRSTLKDSCHEWFQNTELHVPREKLKYLREIGHGWFGKVVEGSAELQGTNLGKHNAKNSNVVVRILTEEATAKEKAWFLSEATPYFKLRHRNILSLFGSCLETDPYLLLFESCPLGDLKGFLRGNQDPETRAALIKENMPTRISIEIGAGLRHMHEHGLAHTDLSARNCLVASDLSIKLGDYGMGVEKYPEDYYVLGDRALPIRWSAPETIECTDTTIETREITPRANLWSYAVLIWEIGMWGKRPYDDFSDEKIIEMLLSSKTGKKEVGSQLLLENSDNCASNLLEAIKTCLVLEPDKRLPLEKVRHVLLKEQLESDTSDFDQRWLSMRPNITREQPRSASLQDLRGSLDSEQWASLTQMSFRLGPEEPVKNVPLSTGFVGRSRYPFRDSDSETEEESWRGRVERGAYTEKVKQKSKSVADLMVLVHIEPDSDADLSLGPQNSFIEKAMAKKRQLPITGSDSDLPSAVFDDQFDLVLRKLRDPLVTGNSARGPKAPVFSVADRPTLLTLTSDQVKRPVLKLAFEPKFESKEKSLETSVENLKKKSVADIQNSSESISRFQTKGVVFTGTSSVASDPESQSGTAVKNEEDFAGDPDFSNDVQVTDLDDDENVLMLKGNNDGAKSESIDVSSWHSALDTALEQKSHDVSAYTTPSPVRKNEDAITPSPQSRAEYSAEDVEDEFSNADDLPGLSKRQLPMDDEDDRKRMSTPDDERSSDSGFRDKESCEEEESPLPGPLPNLVASQANTPKSTGTHDSAEEEQMRVLFELDTILDAECYGTLNDSLDPNLDKLLLHESELTSSSLDTQKEVEQEVNEISEAVPSSSETTGETEKEVMHVDKSSSDDANLTSTSVLFDSQSIMPVDPVHRAALVNDDPNNCPSYNEGSSSWPCLSAGPYDINEDEDSSTMSLRSDNSYVSFGMDEEFVAAIKNELREKLPQAQMPVIETLEPQDDDDPSLVSDVDKNWEDEAEENVADRTGIIDISIRYNTFGTPLSPILEERESATNSESVNLTRDDSQDASIASKGGSNSFSEDDVLFIDTQTNRATIVEGALSHSQEYQESSKRDQCDDNNLFASERKHLYSKPSYSLDKKFGNTAGGTGAPLPSPEEEAIQWQPQISGLSMLPLDNLMSTSFASEQDSEEDNEDIPSEEITGNEVDDEDDDDEDEGDDGLMDEEDDDEEDDETSSSSGEFIWQQYGVTDLESHETDNFEKNEVNKAKQAEEADNDTGEDFGSGDEEEEEEFTPSAWDATLAPHRSALRSPDKTLRTGDQKKSVWFKKQRYHCVYEYPKETPPMENQSPTVSAWEPTSYMDWEEMIDKLDRLNFQPMDYFETNNTRGDEEFFVSSSNRPFQFQSGSGKHVSQFFPGASGSSGAATTPQEAPSQELQQTEEPASTQQQSFSDRQQLGELRHTRDRLKLNLLASPSSLSSNGGSRAAQLCNPAKQGKKVSLGVDEDDDEDDDSAKEAVQTVKPEENVEKEPDAESQQKYEDKQVTTVTVEPSVKTSPSDGQCGSSSNLESNSNRDDLDVD